MQWFYVSGWETTEGKRDHLWFAYASGQPSAEHLVRLFEMAGYSRVQIKSIDMAATSGVSVLAEDQG